MRTFLFLTLFGVTALAAEPVKTPVVEAKVEPAKATKPRLFVMDIAAVGVPKEDATAISDAVVQALTARGLFEVLSTRDAQTLMSAERQKQLLGLCGDQDAQCSSQLGAQLAARFVLSGQLSKVGTAYQLALQTVDTQKQQGIGRSSRITGDLDTLRRLIPYIAAEATGTPLPPPAARWWQWTMISVGAGTVLAGGVLGMLALSREAVLNDELCPTGTTSGERCSGVSLRPRSFYVEQNAQITTQKWVAVSLLGAGAVLAALGVVLMPPAEGQRLSVRLVPARDGFALVGRFW